MLRHCDTRFKVFAACLVIDKHLDRGVKRATGVGHHIIAVSVEIIFDLSVANILYKPAVSRVSFFVAVGVNTPYHCNLTGGEHYLSGS